MWWRLNGGVREVTIHGDPEVGPRGRNAMTVHGWYVKIGEYS